MNGFVEAMQNVCVYLQYTNLCGWQVRVLALLQVSLWVDLSIEQSDRKAPETQRRERTAWWSVRLLFRDTVTVCSCKDNIHWFKLFLLTLQWSRRHKRPGRIWQTVQRWRGTARLQDPPIPRWTDWPETHKKQVKYFSAFTLISLNVIRAAQRWDCNPNLWLVRTFRSSVTDRSTDRLLMCRLQTRRQIYLLSS